MDIDYLGCGVLPVRLSFGNLAAPAYFATANQASQPAYKPWLYTYFQGCVEGTGAITATIDIQASNDDDTGRGIIHGGNTAPGLPVLTASGSPTLTSPDRAFTADLVGKLVEAPGVPVGTTVSAVTAGGSTLTMSGNATATSATPVQCLFRALRWSSTALGTITLSGNDLVCNGFQHVGSCRFVRAVLSNVTGTVSGVRVWMGS